MYIKEITVAGFKSYKQKTVIQDFDPGFNVVVGRNGSGKSNLFSAIEFALTLEYRYLKPQERNALLHNGKRSILDHAYVEIVFDNSDKKLPINSETVTFRRILASKKDKFYCNGKELCNAKQFLDMAGFTNPYFIVKQGKVHQLATSSDAFRLKLLEDVAGSTSYDDKLTQCVKLLEDGEMKKQEVDKVMKDLEERKQRLEEEVKGLKQYVAYDAKRRAIEYLLNEREQDMYRKSIEQCEEERRSLMQHLEPHQTQLQDLRRKIQKAEEELLSKKADIERAVRNKEESDLEIPKLVAEQTRLRNLRADYKKEYERKTTSRTTSKRVQELEEEILDVERKLNAAKKALNRVNNEALDVDKQIIEIDAERKTAEVRLRGLDKKAIKDAIRSLKQEIEESNKRKEALKMEGRKLNSEKKRLMEGDPDNNKYGHEKIKTKLEELAINLGELAKIGAVPDSDLFNCERERSNLWKELNDVQLRLEHQANVDLEVMERLCRRAGREVINGMRSVEEVLDHFKGQDRAVFNGYCGIVADNIQYEDDYGLAVEAAAGNKLFIHIVKDDNIARRIMQEFNRQKKKGSVMFLPLNRIQVPTLVLPENSNTLLRMTDVVQVVEDYRKVMDYVFGTTILCRELSDATAAAKVHKVNCVTTEGDKVSRGGPIRGGYMEDLRTMELLRARRNSRNDLQLCRKRKEEIEGHLQKLGEKIEEVTKLRRQRENQRCSYMEEKTKLEMALSFCRNGLKRVDASLSEIECERLRLERGTHELECRKAKLELELQRKDPPHSKDDRMKVVQLRKQGETLLRRKREAIMPDKLQKEREVTAWEQKFEQLGVSIEEERQKNLQALSSQEHQGRIDEVNDMIQTITEEIKQKQNELNQLSLNLQLENAEFNQVKFRIEKLQELEKAQQLKLSYLEKQLQKIATTVAGHNERLQRTIQASLQLGTVPSGNEKYQSRPSKFLYQHLSNINQYISQLDSVNQKAAEQHREILEKHDSFMTKLGQLDGDKQDLESLLQDLQGKKADAIQKNFKVLQEQFQQIFSQIVPQGTSELMLYGKEFEINSKNLESRRIKEFLSSSELRGLKVNVNFINGRTPEMSNLLHLSGGQKSLVALCLILAIQKIDPVPFYLFDEVDQALDPQYRSAVTKVIYDLATQMNLQFICTTFRKEFVIDAHKFFGVSIRNGCSNVRVITAEEARDFVESDSSDGTGSNGREGTGGDSTLDFVVSD